MSGTNLRRDQALALLEWQIAMGADEAIGEIARDWLAPASVAEPATVFADFPPASPLPNPPPRSPGQARGGEGRVGVPPPLAEAGGGIPGPLSSEAKSRPDPPI